MAFNLGGSFSGDYGDIKPGYKNPLGSGASSVKGDYDWGSFSKGTDWGQTPGIDRTGLFESLFDKAKTKDKYRSQAEREDGYRYGGDRAYGGEWSRSGGGQILDNLGALYPQQHSPMFIPGQPGQEGKGSAIGKAIGTAAGIVAAPFTGGASLGAIPFLTGAGGTIGGAF